MPIIGVYAIRNRINGKNYVGSTSKNVRGRFRSHRHMLRYGKHHSPALQRAWNKHGENAFEFVILETLTKCSNVLTAEQNWIDKLKANNPRLGYNVCPVAGTRKGSPQPESMKKTLSARFKGIAISEEHRRNIGRGNRGKKRTAEQRENIRAAMIRYFDIEQNRQKVSMALKGKPSPFKGKHHTPKSRMLMSEKAKQRIDVCIANLPEMTAEIRAKISKTKKGQRLGIARPDPRSPTKDQVLWMKRLRSRGATYRDIAEQIGKNVTTVFRYLNN